MTPGFFRTMRIPLLQGRLLTDSDGSAGEGVVVISQELAREQFPGVNPIGQQIMNGWSAPAKW